MEHMYEEEGIFVCRDCWKYTKEDLTPVNCSFHSLNRILIT